MTSDTSTAITINKVIDGLWQTCNDNLLMAMVTTTMTVTILVVTKIDNDGGDPVVGNPDDNDGGDPGDDDDGDDGNGDNDDDNINADATPAAAACCRSAAPTHCYS